MDLRYGHVEAALARVFGVGFEDAPAFRARIRNLRNLGIPALDKPGRGQQVSYTLAHALELLLALEIESLGIAPKLAASHARRTANVLAANFDDAEAHGLSWYLLIRPGERVFSSDRDLQITMGPFSRKDLASEISSLPRVTVINLSNSIAILMRELQARRAKK